MADNVPDDLAQLEGFQGLSRNPLIVEKKEAAPIAYCCSRSGYNEGSRRCPGSTRRGAHSDPALLCQTRGTTCILPKIISVAILGGLHHRYAAA